MNKYLDEYPSLLPFVYDMYSNLYMKKKVKSPLKNEPFFIKQEKDDDDCQEIPGLLNILRENNCKYDF